MNWKKNYPHLLALLVFFIVTIIVFKPYFFEGKGVYQHDIFMATGGNHLLKEYRAETGNEALWMNHMFSGMPAYLNGVQYSGDLMKYVYKVLTLGLPHPISLTFISFLSFYILLISFRVMPILAIGGALLFGLNGFHIISIDAGHNAKIAATALMPLVLAGVHLSFGKRRWLGVGLTALALGLQIRANHPQITYYLLLVILVYGLHQLLKTFKNKDWKPFLISTGGLILAAILAVGANSGRLYHTYQYGAYSIRGGQVLETQDQGTGLDYDYAFRYSNGIFEPLVMFVPNILGGSSQQQLSDKSNSAEALMERGYTRLQAKEQIKSMPTYWGDQPLTAPYYAGSLLLFLLILGLFVLPANQKYWLLVIAILGIILSWGKNFAGFNNLLFDFLPGYNKFRSVTFTIIMPMLAMNLIGFLGLKRWLELEKAAQYKALKYSFLVTTGFFLSLVLFAGAFSYRGAIDEQLAGSFPDWLIDAIRADRKALLRQDALRGLIFTVLLTGGLYLNYAKQMPKQIILAALVFLVGVDVLLLGKRFLNADDFQKNVSEKYFTPTEADSFLMDAAAPGERVLNLQNPWNEARTSYYHESVGGYHGAKMRRYQDLIDRHLNEEINQAVTSLKGGSADFSDLQVMNMLNTKFLKAGPQRQAVIENKYAFGNAWMVTKTQKVNGPDEAIQALGEVDLRNTAIIDQTAFGGIEAGNGEGKIILLKKDANQLTYAFTSTQDQLAVFSEIYYPMGWEASVDNQPVSIHRVNYLLRALEIPAGEHEITFTFNPKSYASNNQIMLICGILILLGFGYTAFLSLRSGHPSANSR